MLPSCHTQAIKVLAVTLRGALSMKDADAFRAVYCWQTVRCLELWSRVLAEHAPTSVRHFANSETKVPFL